MNESCADDLSKIIIYKSNFTILVTKNIISQSQILEAMHFEPENSTYAHFVAVLLNVPQ